MKPEELKRLRAALETPFPWGKFKGKKMDLAPSPMLKWTAEKWNDDVIAAAADIVWQWRESMGTHFYE